MNLRSAIYFGPAGEPSKPKRKRKPKPAQPRTIIPEKPFYASAEVATLADVTLRQLQWWDEQRIIRPKSKIGHKREYAQEQLQQIEALAELRRAGVSLQRARKVIFKYPDSLPEAVNALFILKKLGLKVR